MIVKPEMPKPDDKKCLHRRLGLFDSTMMMVGIVIGSGIFLTTGTMAAALPSANLILVAWVVGGLLVLTGALTFGELGASFPRAGVRPFTQPRCVAELTMKKTRAIDLETMPSRSIP